MNDKRWVQLNAVLGSLVVMIGLWLLIGAFPIAWGVAASIVLALLLAWKCPSIGYIWSASTFLLGLESLAWPISQMVDIRKLGPEPPLEDLQRIFTAVLFGLFSGVFWMIFAYGIFKRTRGDLAPPKPVVAPPSSGKKKSSKKPR
ncbi:MAG: hypothetical protein AB7P17_01605 [Nitrospirales bacterium]|nr:hypothetical protein [Nitrospirales bacterium]